MGPWVATQKSPSCLRALWSSGYTVSACARVTATCDGVAHWAKPQAKAKLDARLRSFVDGRTAPSSPSKHEKRARLPAPRFGSVRLRVYQPPVVVAQGSRPSAPAGPCA